MGWTKKFHFSGLNGFWQLFHTLLHFYTCRWLAYYPTNSLENIYFRNKAEKESVFPDECGMRHEPKACVALHTSTRETGFSRTCEEKQWKKYSFVYPKKIGNSRVTLPLFLCPFSSVCYRPKELISDSQNPPFCVFFSVECNKHIGFKQISTCIRVTKNLAKI